MTANISELASSYFGFLQICARNPNIVDCAVFFQVCMTIVKI